MTLVATVLAVTFLAASPVLAHAGLFSFVNELISGKTDVYERSHSAQNMALLSAALTPEKEVGGGDITIIDGSSLLPEAGVGLSGDEKIINSNGQISTYVVRPGDNLSQIAKMFGVSVNTIVWGNDLSGTTIKEGQLLVILPISGIKYTVKKGDTLASIAKDHKGDLQEILDYNDLVSSSKIALGDVIIIPDGEVTHTVHSAPTPSSSSAKTVNSSGYFIKPIAKYTRTQGIHGYNGVDLAAPAGTPIVASANGSVVIARGSGWNGGYGQYVVIRHPNGVQTLYSHMSEVIVSSGSNVLQGQVIGYVGSTGKSTGNHLHFEVRGAKNPF